MEDRNASEIQLKHETLSPGREPELNRFLGTREEIDFPTLMRGLGRVGGQFSRRDLNEFYVHSILYSILLLSMGWYARTMFHRVILWWMIANTVSYLSSVLG